MQLSRSATCTVRCRINTACCREETHASTLFVRGKSPFHLHLHSQLGHTQGFRPLQELPRIRARISGWWGLCSLLPPTPRQPAQSGSACILLPRACRKPQRVEKPQGRNKPANSFRSPVRNSTMSSSAEADALLCPRGRASPVLGSRPMPSVCLEVPVDPQTSPGRTHTHWADAWHSKSPGAEIRCTSRAAGGGREGNCLEGSAPVSTASSPARKHPRASYSTSSRGICWETKHAGRKGLGFSSLSSLYRAARPALLAERQVRLSPWQRLLAAELDAIWGTSSEKSVLE